MVERILYIYFLFFLISCNKKINSIKNGYQLVPNQELETILKLESNTLFAEWISKQKSPNIDSLLGEYNSLLARDSACSMLITQGNYITFSDFYFTEHLQINDSTVYLSDTLYIIRSEFWKFPINTPLASSSSNCVFTYAPTRFKFPKNWKPIKGCECTTQCTQIGNKKLTLIMLYACRIDTRKNLVRIASKQACNQARKKHRKSLQRIQKRLYNP